MSSQLEEIKKHLEQVKAQADTAKAQEEYLLKQLRDNYEVSSVKEAEELIATLLEEKEDIDKTIKQKTDSVITKMEQEGFI